MVLLWRQCSILSVATVGQVRATDIRTPGRFGLASASVPILVELVQAGAEWRGSCRFGCFIESKALLRTRGYLVRGAWC
ncbi:MAG: hypothetical protein J3Q66DRAFT_351587, partial [Benniella sp.]